MSTFNGLIEEFPKIRVDYFRDYPNRRPLACFLSHIHSDHLAGLENLLSPFIYCSAGTKEMLLRLERRPCRINYELGILEARVQKYNNKNLKNILKPIPLQTPTVIELSPGDKIQVTLFDANHCPGAVMFLFEGDGKAVLYTGDIRSEPWFVDSIVHNPSMAALGKYASGKKILDTIYLDTSFIEDVPFQTKAQGIEELRTKLQKYPKDTVFHLQAWTYGYEDVWAALADDLDSKIHVDKYKMRVYSSLLADVPNSKREYQQHLAPEGPRLVGFMCGNEPQEGCLTLDDKVRIHSCEKGTYCETLKQAQAESRVVWIAPCIAHLPDGRDIVEAGVGGGGGDLERDAEIEGLSPDEIEDFLTVISSLKDLPEDVKEKTKAFVLKLVSVGRSIPLGFSMDEHDKVVLGAAVQSITKRSLIGRGMPGALSADVEETQALPKHITFPYSRHSSYAELRHFVSIFRPMDVWPCTVSTVDWVDNGISIRGLFGDHCSGELFRHDIVLEQLAAEIRLSRQDHESQTTCASDDLPIEAPMELISDPRPAADASHSSVPATLEAGAISQDRDDGSRPQVQALPPRKRAYAELDADSEPTAGNDALGVLQDSQASTLSEHAFEIRAASYLAVLENARGNPEFQGVGLISTAENHTASEEELGES